MADIQQGSPAQGSSAQGSSEERIATLLRRLAEAEAALQAIISGEVDAVASPLTAAPVLLQAAQDALRDSEARYREIVAQSPSVVCELAPDGTTRFLNKRITDLLGYETSALMGRNFWDAILPPDQRTRAESLWKNLQEERITEFEVPVRTVDGTRRTFVWNSTNRYSAAGSLESVIVFGLDITARKREEQTARRLAAERAGRTEAEAAEKKAELLAEASRILSSSLDHEVTLANVAALVVPALGDWCAVDIIDEGGTVRRVAVQHPDPLKVQWAEDVRRRYPTDAGAAMGIPNVLRTGKTEFYPELAEMLAAAAQDAAHLDLLRSLGLRSAIIVPLSIRDKTVGAITLVVAESGRSYDESDVRTAEDLANRAAVAIENARLYQSASAARTEAERARVDAENANRAKSEFLASMSHELRTPLNAIAGYVQLLEEGIQGPINDNQREYLRRVRRSQEHLLGLINGVLNFAKLEAGHVQFDITQVKLGKLLSEVDDLIAPQIRDKGIEYENRACDVQLSAQADRDKTRQIVLNLLSNAVKFTPKGGKIVVECGGRGSQVSLKVRDSGIGIPSDKLDAIFDPFVQIGKQASRQGTGLGLAISRDLARAMQGDLAAASVMGEGSEFTLTLPLATKAAIEASARAADGKAVLERLPAR